jgi:hypothetical protein
VIELQALRGMSRGEGQRRVVAAELKERRAPGGDGVAKRVERRVGDRPGEDGRSDVGWPRGVRIEAVRAEWARRAAGPEDDPNAPRPADIAAAVLAWAVPYPTLDALRGAVAARRAALAELCRDDAELTFATAHATKGLEFDHVAVIGMERGRFPSARSLADAVEPERALEEERRLAYVAWTRACRSLTLVYDPSTPSSFLIEAFSPEELGVEDEAAAG